MKISGTTKSILLWLGVTVLLLSAAWVAIRLVNFRTQGTESLPTIWFEVTAQRGQLHNPTSVYLERVGSDTVALSFEVRGRDREAYGEVGLAGVGDDVSCMRVGERVGFSNYQAEEKTLTVEKRSIPPIKRMARRLPLQDEYIVYDNAQEFLNPGIVHPHCSQSLFKKSGRVFFWRPAVASGG